MQAQPETASVETSEYLSYLSLISRFYEIEPKTPVHLEIAAKTHPGKVRDQNEDHYLVVRRRRDREILATSLPEELLPSVGQYAYTLAVADGMGGRSFGELASLLALRTGWDLGEGEVKWTMKVNDTESEELKRKAQVLFDLLHHTIQATSHDEPRLAGMGTTLTVCYSTGPELFVMHAGDSRAYLYREGRLQRLSHDHTVAQNMIDAGLATPGSREERRSRRFLTNCLGGDQVAVEVDVNRHRLRDGDILLVCSDGLTDMVDDEQITRILRGHPDPTSACDTLLEQALETGGRDNITIIVARYTFPEGSE